MFRQLSPGEVEDIRSDLILDAQLSLSDDGGADVRIYHHRTSRKKYLRLKVRPGAGDEQLYFVHGEAYGQSSGGSRSPSMPL